MAVLLVDNHDSFVYNIYQLLVKSGVDVDVMMNDQIDVKKIPRYDRIIISPGPGNPENLRDVGNLKVMMRSIQESTKVLGICFGHQFLASYLGSKIIKTEKIMHGQIDMVLHTNSTLYRNVPESFSVIRYHSLAIVPNDNIIVDCVSQSDNTIMGFHGRDSNFFGVQFHPESYYSEFGETIIRNFLGDVI
ncbi:MAG: aminodeoxychorismate/anthranilate synthase component II [Thermoplasmataceae archaeon]